MTCKRMRHAHSGGASVWRWGATSLSATAADWPNFRGPNQNGISPEKGINTNWAASEPPLLWSTPLHDKGYAGPAVARGLVYVIDHEGTTDIVRAFALTSGKPVWQFAYEAPGNENYGFARATPTVDEGRIFTISRNGLIHCLLWQRLTSGACVNGGCKRVVSHRQSAAAVKQVEEITLMGLIPTDGGCRYGPNIQLVNGWAGERVVNPCGIRG